MSTNLEPLVTNLNRNSTAKNFINNVDINLIDPYKISDMQVNKQSKEKPENTIKTQKKEIKKDESMLNTIMANKILFNLKIFYTQIICIKFLFTNFIEIFGGSRSIFDDITEDQDENDDEEPEEENKIMTEYSYKFNKEKNLLSGRNVDESSKSILNKMIAQIF